MLNKLGSRENASEFAIFLELENENSFYFSELYFVFFNCYDRSTDLRYDLPMSTNTK